MANTQRDTSPTKRQRTHDDVLPTRSVSITDPSRILHLGQYTTFSPPGSQLSGSYQGSRASTSTSSPRRNSSPTRDALIMLSHASPSILIQSYNGAKPLGAKTFSNEVINVMKRLGPDQMSGWVPKCLEVCAYTLDMPSN